MRKPLRLHVCVVVRVIAVVVGRVPYGDNGLFHVLLFGRLVFGTSVCCVVTSGNGRVRVSERYGICLFCAIPPLVCACAHVEKRKGEDGPRARDGSPRLLLLLLLLFLASRKLNLFRACMGIVVYSQGREGPPSLKGWTCVCVNNPLPLFLLGKYAPCSLAVGQGDQ